MLKRVCPGKIWGGGLGPSTSAIFRSRNFGFGARLNLIWKSTPKFSFRFLRQWFVRLRLRLISLRARRAARIARWITVRNAIAARAAIASQLSRRPLAREDFRSSEFRRDPISLHWPRFGLQMAALWLIFIFQVFLFRHSARRHPCAEALQFLLRDNGPLQRYHP